MLSHLVNLDQKNVPGRHCTAQYFRHNYDSVKGVGLDEGLLES